MADRSAEVPCHVCGYDLRAHPSDGKCSECGASVAEARRLAAIPRRPAWRDSDPRWRRRMLAGAWILVLVPLMQALVAFDWASSMPVPALLEIGRATRTLDNTYLCNMNLYEPLIFCIGIVLLFAKERGRRRAPLDWTRRWGVLCSYVVMLLSIVQVIFITAFIMAGIAALFMSMRPKYQPGATQLLVDVTFACLRYGPYPKRITFDVLVAFSSITILLACVPLWDALRSNGPKPVARILLVPLGLFAVFHIAQAARHSLGFLGGTEADVAPYGAFFSPLLLIKAVGYVPPWWALLPLGAGPIVVEVIKWCIVLAIAIWLTLAQLTALSHSKRPAPANKPATDQN